MQIDRGSGLAFLGLIGWRARQYHKVTLWQNLSVDWFQIIVSKYKLTQKVQLKLIFSLLCTVILFDFHTEVTEGIQKILHLKKILGELTYAWIAVWLRSIFFYLDLSYNFSHVKTWKSPNKCSKDFQVTNRILNFSTFCKFVFSNPGFTRKLHRTRFFKSKQLCVVVTSAAGDTIIHST